jgi:signal transduction histidine kinase/CheY-like chemotaxis protein
VIHYRKKSGEIFPGETLGTVIKDNNGEIIGYIGVIRDVSELKRAEKEAENMRDQLAQASKMESIGHLTAGIAHDFNNMLGAIMGYAELSQLMLAAGKPHAISHYHEEILKAVNRAKELISQMLTFSRLSPDIKNSVAPVTLLKPIVKEVVALLRSSIPSTVDLNYRIEDDDIKARIQPVHLHQIILNLGINARDAMGEYGKIDISVSHFSADHLQCSACKSAFSGEYAQITVKDSGSGIPAQTLKNIFEPFFTTKGVGKGTGMGLSVVHGLVHALGGHIIVKSDVRSGTSFDILLPLELTTPGLAAPVEKAGVVNIEGARIMVVDDELALSNLLHDYLSVNGAHVVSFTDPIKALEFFIRQLGSIDLLVTDEAMPGLSGMLLAEKMLTIKPDLPIVLCTGYSEHATPEAIEKIGIKGFFHKPINMNELAQKIQALLHRQTSK